MNKLQFKAAMSAYRTRRAGANMQDGYTAEWLASVNPLAQLDSGLVDLLTARWNDAQRKFPLGAFSPKRRKQLGGSFVL